ncbi:MAG TPA: hypothetical protein VFH27_09075, partial [Longimicrobiaceae bacterium]|nr:hypothetical protein [Longimicrobiaceae bacterium]
MNRAQRAVLLACAMGWALLACVQMLRDYLLLAGRGQPVRMGAVAGSELTLHAVWALLTPGVFAVAARHPAHRLRNLPVHVAGAAGYCVVHLVAVAAALHLGAVDP